MTNETKLESTRKFLAAVCVAAIFSIGKLSVKEYFTAGWRVLRAVTSRRGKVGSETLMARNAVCEQCPIRWHGLNTCGSPLADNPDAGCWCYLPKHNARVESRCWADENLDLEEIGWKTSPKTNPPQ